MFWIVGYFDAKSMDILALGLILLQLQLASVDGIVTKPGSSEPLGRAKVTLAPVVPGLELFARWFTLTEDDGRFAIRDVPPGNYRLLVDSPRYGTVTYGQRRPDGPALVLSLSPGERLADLRISTMPTGVIAGRVTERNGEPAVRATVHALRYAYQNGKRVLRPFRSTSTDDRGEYRLFWLPPGQYIIAATLNESPFEAGVSRPTVYLRPDGGVSLSFEGSVGLFLDSFLKGTVVNRVLDNGTIQEESWLPAYYPSAIEARFAVPVDVAPNATVTGANISIGPSRVQRVRGVLAGAAPASRTTQVLLLPRDSLFGIPLTTNGAGASFEFTGVIPGAYYLFATDSQAGLVSNPLPVEVGNRDVDGLRIPLSAGTQIGATVMLDNPSENSGLQPIAGIGIHLVPDILGLPTANTNGQTDGAGRAAISHVAAGNYRIQILPPSNLPGQPKPFHLKSARFGGSDVSGGLQIADTSAGNMEIVLTNESGSLEGSVTGAGQSTSEGATVVLIPERGRNRSELYRVTVSDQSGRFRFGDVAPGDYKLFSWEDVEPGAWQDPDFLNRYETKGQTVHITGSSRLDVQVVLIPMP